MYQLDGCDHCQHLDRQNQLGQIEITQGFKLETAGRASSVTYLQIVLAYSWGILLFGEYPNALSILGAALVVLGVFSVTRRPSP